MLLSLLGFALAEPPSIDTPLVTGARAKKDVALVISQSDYANLPDVPAAEADAQAVYDWLVSARGVDPERVTRVNNANRQEMLSALRAARDLARSKKGTLWVYYAGHGGVVSGGDRVLLPVDAPTAEPLADSLDIDEVKSVLEASRAGEIVLWIDASFGGVDRTGLPAFKVAAPAGPSVVPANERLSVWTATSGDESSPLYPPANHSLATWLLVGGLRGWADGAAGEKADGKITTQELHTYIAKTGRTLGGPDFKPTRESRADPNGWVLVSANNLETGPDKEQLMALARAEKLRRVEVAQARVRTVATTDWTAVVAVADLGGPEAEAALRGFVGRWDLTFATVDGVEVAIVVPEVAEAKARLDALARVGKKKGTKRTRKGKKKGPAVVAVVNPVCGELTPLEGSALLGTLSEEVSSCLENRLLEEKLQTTKDRISRLLMVNAEAKGDSDEWLSLAQRHLEDFDRSDPDLCFKYALVLARGDVADGKEVIHWADYALENKHVWEGPLYTARVFNIYRLKAETATRMWHDSEAVFLEERSDDNEAAADEARGLARNYSREWLDYARASGQPVDRALEMCLSASGNAAACPVD